METDPHGTFVLSAIIWGFIIGFAMSFTVSAVSQAIENDGEVNWDVAVVVNQVIAVVAEEFLVVIQAGDGEAGIEQEIGRAHV